MTAFNPYRSPHSQVSDPADREVGEVRMLSARGRLGRVRYLAYTVGVYLLVSFASSIIGGGAMAALGPGIGPTVNVVLGLTLSVGFLVYSFAPTIQRLHDIDLSGWLSLLTLVPLVNFIFFVVLTIVPGTAGRNRFGAQPPPNTAGVTIVSILASILFALSVIGLLAAIAIPAYEGYLHRAGQTPHSAPAPSRR